MFAFIRSKNISEKWTLHRKSWKKRRRDILYAVQNKELRRKHMRCIWKLS